MNCHTENRAERRDSRSATDEKVQFIRDAYAEGTGRSSGATSMSCPDYASFPHNAHVNAGVSCYLLPRPDPGRCPSLLQAESLSMGWCLDCHRNPDENLVPKDKVTDLYWVAEPLVQHRSDENGNTRSSVDR